MNLNANLVQHQVLKLSMTQELSQAIELLQFSALELNSFLEEKALENPLIELSKNNISTESYVKKSSQQSSDSDDDESDWIEQISEKTDITMSEFLLSQIDFKQMSPKIIKIVQNLINRLDENGYLRENVNNIATELKVSGEDVELGLLTLQQLEPAGIGAANLQECLILQIKTNDEIANIAKNAIELYFTDFANKNWRRLAKILKVTMRDIQEAFDLVQTLNPRPGAMFATEETTYIVPDVIVELKGTDFIVTVVDEHIPSLSYNEQYYQQLNQYKNNEVTDYLQQKSREFNWILRSIQQRHETLRRVMVKIIQLQQQFFQNKSGQLLPMTMKEVADSLEIHESTVSRTVREKYAQTPFGTFPLRSFFTSTVQTDSDTEQSSAQVKTLIEQIVANEDKYKPLSDQKIVDQLSASEGIVISRRTVAKYREQLGIESSTKRKRFK